MIAAAITNAFSRFIGHKFLKKAILVQEQFSRLSD
jgi:hypothetical protein